MAAIIQINSFQVLFMNISQIIALMKMFPPSLYRMHFKNDLGTKPLAVM